MVASWVEKNAGMVSAAVIGLGNIGARFQSATTDLETVQNHASCYHLHPRTQLMAGCSPESQDRLEFTERFHVPAYADVEELLAQKPDVVSICSPTPFHYEQACACLDHGVRRIWLEKPATTTLQELQTLRERAHGCGARILVNCQRRYTALYLALRQVVVDQPLGKLHQLQMTYSRGLELNGYHLLDIVFFLLGDPDIFEVMAVEPNRMSASPSAIFRLGNAIPVVCTGMDLDYHNQDVVLTFARGRVSVIYGGLAGRWEERIEHPLFPGFYTLREKRDALLAEGGFQQSMRRTLDDLLADNVPPVCGLREAERVQTLIARIRGQA